MMDHGAAGSTYEFDASTLESVGTLFRGHVKDTPV